VKVYIFALVCIHYHRAPHIGISWPRPCSVLPSSKEYINMNDTLIDITQDTNYKNKETEIITGVLTAMTLYLLALDGRCHLPNSEANSQHPIIGQETGGMR